MAESRIGRQADVPAMHMHTEVLAGHDETRRRLSTAAGQMGIGQLYITRTKQCLRVIF